jgi:hypothetical protein
VFVYKLTDENDQTHGGCQWGPGVVQQTDGSGELCGPGWIHVYDDPLLAVLHNPIHGNFDLATAHLWECKTNGIRKDDHGIKAGYTEVCTIHRIELPEITDVQKTAYGILCAWFVYHDDRWRKWARRWLSGDNRSESLAWTEAVAMFSARAVSAREARAWAAAVTAVQAVRTAVQAVGTAGMAADKQPLNLPRLARAAMRVTV